MQNLSSVNKDFKNILKKRGMLSNKMGAEISDSWLRCISAGLDPFKDPKQSNSTISASTVKSPSSWISKESTKNAICCKVKKLIAKGSIILCKVNCVPDK